MHGENEATHLSAEKTRSGEEELAVRDALNGNDKWMNIMLKLLIGFSEHHDGNLQGLFLGYA